MPKHGQEIEWTGRRYRFSDRIVALSQLQDGDLVAVPGANGGPAQITKISKKNISMLRFSRLGKDGEPSGITYAIAKPRSFLIGAYVLVNNEIRPIGA